MERLDKQELRHQQVVDALQKQVAAAGATVNVLYSCSLE